MKNLEKRIENLESAVLNIIALTEDKLPGSGLDNLGMELFFAVTALSGDEPSVTLHNGESE